MKFFIVLAVALVAAAAEDVPIVKSSFEQKGAGSYAYEFQTGDGSHQQVEAVIKNPNSEHPSAEVKGSFNYVSPEGTPVEIKYVADENGFQPQGAQIPVAPPTPEAILRSLAYIAAHPQPIETKKY